jgi:molybdenum cofactor cytidylyltransferase
MTAPIGAVLLAAGLSSRHQPGDKLLRAYRGAPLVSYPAQAIMGAPLTARAIVTGPNGDAVFEAAQADEYWLRVHNRDPAAGLSHSLHLAITALADQDLAGLLILLGDMPDIPASVLHRAIAAFDPSAFGLVAACNGMWGHPVILSPAAIAAFATVHGDRGARALLQRHAANVTVLETNHPGVLRDFDHADDFEGPD